MRLGIEINNEFLDLFPGTALQLDMESPMYFGDRDPEVIRGIKAYDIKIPLSAPNRRRLKRPDLLDNPDDFIYNDPCKIFYDNDLILEGTAKIILSHSEDYCNLRFTGGLAGNLNELKTKTLPELTLGGDRDVGPLQTDVIDHANDVVANSDNYDYVFGHVIYQLLETPTELAENYRYVNYYHDDSFFKTKLIDGLTEHSTLSPYPKVKYLLDQGFEESGYKMTGVFDTNEHSVELGNLVIYNNFTLDKAIDMEDDMDVDNMELFTNINLQNHVPATTINTFLKQVCNTFGWVPIINTTTKTVAIFAYNDLLTAKPSQDWSDKIERTFIKEAKSDNIPTKFCYAHSDDYPGFLAYYTGVLTDITNPEYTILEPYELVSELPSTSVKSNLHFVGSHSGYYRTVATGSPAFYNLVNKHIECYGEGEYSFEVDAKTMHLFSSSVAGGFQRRIAPITANDLISPIFSDVQKTTETTFLFWRGLQEDVDGDDWPQLSNQVYDVDENKITDANLSLLWNTTYGLYPTWWAKWHAFLLKTRSVTYATRLDTRDLRDLDWSKKVTLGVHDYFIKRIQITFTTSEIKTAKVEYKKVN